MNTNKITIGTSKLKEKNFKNILNIYYGVVISNDDPDDMMRLKIRITGIDNNISDENLPYVLPILPKFFYILPKVGEAVRVIISDTEKPYNLRTWIGSIISQPQFFEYDPYYYTALNGSEHQRVQQQRSLKNLPDGKYLHPEKDDIAIIGRYNTDIIQKKKEIILRCGVHSDNDITKLNRKNPNYIKLYFNKDNISTNIIVADRIGLMSHKGKKKFNTILNDEDVDKFFNESHPMVKGDVLAEYLKIIRDTILNHVHGGTNIPANNSNNIKKLKEINIENILNEFIKLN